MKHDDRPIEIGTIPSLVSQSPQEKADHGPDWNAPTRLMWIWGDPPLLTRGAEHRVAMAERRARQASRQGRAVDLLRRARLWPTSARDV